MADNKVFTPGATAPLNNNTSNIKTQIQGSTPFPLPVVADEVASISLSTILRKILGRFSFGAVGAITDNAGNVIMDKNGIHIYNTTDGTTGGAGSGGAGNQYVAVKINGVTYKLLHDGTI